MIIFNIYTLLILLCYEILGDISKYWYKCEIYINYGIYL